MTGSPPPFAPALAAIPVIEASPSPLDVDALRARFPILGSRVHGRPLVYLDNAATTQKPDVVIDRLARFYGRENANVHRGVHALSVGASEAYEAARLAVRGFLNAADPREIVFVRGTTEAINLVAQSYGRAHFAPGDEILVSVMEHHSNIVPWQMVCRETGARLRQIPVDEAGELQIDELASLMTDRTRLVAVVHVSNALGSVNPVRRIVELAHTRGIPVLVDGAQAAAHTVVDVQALDCDFYAFSGHKVYGPTGIGVLYAKAVHLEAMPPYQGGGDMITSVTFEESQYNVIPHKFEAGTPDIAGAVGLAAAIEFVQEVGMARIEAHEAALIARAAEAIAQVPSLRVIGAPARRAGVLSFVMEDVHPHDIGTVLDLEGVAIRTGHHCCQPLMHRLGLAATARASFACYNTEEEVAALARALGRVRELFA
jgi:cysteine desulfurase/selenocysteine lyase